MKVKKEGLAPVEHRAESETALAADLEEINLHAKTPLSQEEVYLFAVRLCDNQVDRDGEFFDRAALEQLAPLFVGKSGIFDHQWSAKYQTARIYRTEVLSEAGVVPESGEVFSYLKGYAYMLRSEKNAALIAEIEAGIKKEVSVSCAVSKHLCSICGHEISDRLHCTHVKGQDYEGLRCVVRLADPTDAYEWSFVAVPAQRSAGVVKSLGEAAALEQAVLEKALSPEVSAAMKTLFAEAQCGRHYLESLRAEVLRLGLLAQEDISQATLSAIVAKLGEGELAEMKAAFLSQATKKLPLRTQLSYETAPKAAGQEDQVFCI